MNGSLALFGRVVLPETILQDGAVVLSDGLITYVGSRQGAPVADSERVTDGLIAPGFVDIHCHAGGRYWAYDCPEKAADFHLAHGTTAMLLTLYRDLGNDGILRGLDKIRGAMKSRDNILGAHLEGPYLNPKYGAISGQAIPVRREDYVKFIDSGIVRQWTVSPEQPHACELIRDATAAGIVCAIGHSAASPEQVDAAAEAGARIVTHLFDATGCSVVPTSVAGTLEVSFDMAALLRDDLYYEMIFDSGGVHVRHRLAKLAFKTAGLDRIIAVTDCGTGSEDDSDLNFLNGELMGSKLTMDRVARNLLALGLDAVRVFRLCADNPARAINASRVGRIAVGNRADILLCSDDLTRIEVLR